mmetsp:Transcript_60427/g.129576  ORF Transcript_60427/g.129576 Transcript_60427/m.129576 type:complete len:307 (-) Transcript_60427:411-1331(-)
MSDSTMSFAVVTCFSSSMISSGKSILDGTASGAQCQSYCFCSLLYSKPSTLMPDASFSKSSALSWLTFNFSFRAPTGSGALPPTTHFTPSWASGTPLAINASFSLIRSLKLCAPMGSPMISKRRGAPAGAGAGTERVIGSQMLAHHLLSWWSLGSQVLGVFRTELMNLLKRFNSWLPFWKRGGMCPSRWQHTSRWLGWKKRHVSSYQQKEWFMSPLHQLRKTGIFSWNLGRSEPIEDKSLLEPEVKRIIKRKQPWNRGSPSCAFLATCTRNSPPMSKPMTPSKGPVSLRYAAKSSKVFSMPSQDSL